jgi:predicted nuclease with TOPRIM domain
MNLPEFAQISEENELLRDQLREREDEVDRLYAEINELKAQLNAKEEFATVHRQIEGRSDGIWVRDVTVIAGEWNREA